MTSYIEGTMESANYLDSATFTQCYKQVSSETCESNPLVYNAVGWVSLAITYPTTRTGWELVLRMHSDTRDYT